MIASKESPPRHPGFECSSTLFGPPLSSSRRKDHKLNGGCSSILPQGSAENS